MQSEVTRVSSIKVIREPRKGLPADLVWVSRHHGVPGSLRDPTTPTSDDLKQAELYLVGIEAAQLQSREALGGELPRLWANGLSLEEIGFYGPKVANTSAVEVNATARKYFPAAKTAIVAVRKEKVIREALSPFGIPFRCFNE